MILDGICSVRERISMRTRSQLEYPVRSTWLRDRVLDLKRNVMNSTPSAQWNRQRVFSALACSFGTVRGALEHAAKSIVLPRKCRYCSQDITDRNPVRGDVCAACLRHAGRAATY